MGNEEKKRQAAAEVERLPCLLRMINKMWAPWSLFTNYVDNSITIPNYHFFGSVLSWENKLVWKIKSNWFDLFSHVGYWTRTCSAQQHGLKNIELYIYLLFQDDRKWMLRWLFIIVLVRSKKLICTCSDIVLHNNYYSSQKNLPLLYLFISLFCRCGSLKNLRQHSWRVWIGGCRCGVDIYMAWYLQLYGR